MTGFLGNRLRRLEAAAARRKPAPVAHPAAAVIADIVIEAIRRDGERVAERYALGGGTVAHEATKARRLRELIFGPAEQASEGAFWALVGEGEPPEVIAGWRAMVEQAGGDEPRSNRGADSLVGGAPVR